jgi:RNA polymerase sigma-70 factor (ECF subfamily)
VSERLSQLPDEALVRRAGDGDGQALQVLLARHSQRLHARVRTLVSPAVLRKVSASDILQEAYVVVHQRLQEFDDRGAGSFGAWLARIVELKAKHAVRRYKGTAKRAAAAEVSRHERGDTVNFAGQAPTPSQVAMGDELKSRVRSALETLSPDHREIIRLRQEEHLSIEAAAARMGRTQDAVKKLYARALAKLAERLDLGAGP